MGKHTCTQTGDRTANIERSILSTFTTYRYKPVAPLRGAAVYAPGGWKTIHTISGDIGKATNNVAELEVVLKVL